MKKQDSRVLKIAVPLVTAAIIVGAWAVAAAAVGEPIVLPSPLAVLKEFFLLFADGAFYAGYFATLGRSLIAFAASFTLAYAAAVWARRSEIVSRTVMTVLPLVRALPTVAVALLLVLWTSSRAAAVIVTMLVVFPTLYTNAENSLSAVTAELSEMCKVYRVPKKTRVVKIYLPLVAPSAVTAAGAGFSLNVKLMVAAEVIAATARGLGPQLNIDKINYETAHLLALVLAIVVTGIAVELAARLVSRAMVKKYA
ncbi:MAG: hypothetical protein DBX59_03260 [Bacillota bacterium]|nr:MAG: hypothetical protein DBX59_03260 [Bacillota bacterium]